MTGQCNVAFVSKSKLPKNSKWLLDANLFTYFDAFCILLTQALMERYKISGTVTSYPTSLVFLSPQGLDLKEIKLETLLFHTRERLVCPAKVHVKTLSGEGMSGLLGSATPPMKVRYVKRSICSRRCYLGAVLWRFQAASSKAPISAT